MAMSSVAVLGTGAMGSRIARRVLDAGHDVVVWNRTRAKAEPLVAAGARSAATPAEAARGAEATITMLAGPDALRAVVEGPDGLAAGVGDAATVLEMSTVGPHTIAWLRSTLPAGVGLLDAPVQGSLGEAEGGSLHVWVGGPDDLVERWTPLLETLGEPIHVGALGMGAATKLVTNATLVGTMTLLGETIALADALGVPRDVAFRALSATPLAAQAERRREPLATGRFPRRFDLALASKDARLVVEAARAAGLDARVLEAAGAWFAAAEDAGLGERDYSEVLRTILAR
ncbi:MAG TPA: NAD(P)-dependent oxidoreductase [Actinomycetota bacterium]|nr:NAD(P)-dependent oxidoreductase [Actinomycetota bacterium]